MSQDLYFEKAKNIFPGEDIPPEPAIIKKIEVELEKPDVDFSQITKLINKDLSLASAMLVTINSAYFGLRNKIESVRRAIILLGFNNVLNIVKSIALRRLIGTKPSQLLDEFWQTSVEIGLFSAYLARKIGSMEPDSAYAIGLFHNAGEPLMMKKFNDFEKMYALGCQSKTKPVIDIESNKFGTNHSAVGALLAMKWKLPKIFYKTILYHHNVVAYLNNKGTPWELKRRIALLKIAEYICYKKHEKYNYIPIFEWSIIKEVVLQCLPIKEEELGKMAEHMIAMLDENEANLYS